MFYFSRGNWIRPVSVSDTDMNSCFMDPTLLYDSISFVWPYKWESLLLLMVYDCLSQSTVHSPKHYCLSLEYCEGLENLNLADKSTSYWINYGELSGINSRFKVCNFINRLWEELLFTESKSNTLWRSMVYARRKYR